MMPELSRFFGIVIRMYMEVGAPHHLPHFHAYYQDEVAIVSLDPVDVIAGELPRRQKRLVEAWAELHQDELLADWARLQTGQTPLPIDPLEGGR
jgi:hypothetical protein